MRYPNSSADGGNLPVPAQMLQNVTKCDTFSGAGGGTGGDPPLIGGPGLPNPDLSPEQLRAIDLLLLGKTDASVAQSLSLARMTVWRWKTQDVDFRAELARRREGLWATTEDRYRRLFFRASRVLTKQLDGQDEANAFRAAQALLRMASRLVPPPPQ